MRGRRTSSAAPRPAREQVGGTFSVQGSLQDCPALPEALVRLSPCLRASELAWNLPQAVRSLTGPQWDGILEACIERSKRQRPEALPAVEVACRHVKVRALDATKVRFLSARHSGIGRVVD